MKFSTLSIRIPWKSQYFQKCQRNNVPLSPPINSSKAHKASGFEKENILRFVLNSSDAHRSPWKFRRPGIEKFYAGKKIAFAYSLMAVFVGAILYYVAYALVLWLKMPSDYMKLFSAIVVTIFLSIPYLKTRFPKKRRA